MNVHHEQPKHTGGIKDYLEHLVREGHISHPEDGQLTLGHAVNQLVERGHITPDSPEALRVRIMGAAMRHHQLGLKGKI